MNTFLSIILIVIFTALSILHFYWAMGGKWAFANSAPSTKEGKALFVPGRIASTVVGMGLFLFAMVYAIKGGFYALDSLAWLVKIALWVIPAIFIIRAIGDFNYVGFFKKVKETGFGRMDSRVYSPLCLGIGALGLILAGMF